jgi:hypothetical protein
MKKLLAIALFAVCAFAEGVAGHWQLAMDSPHGPLKGSVEFKLDGSKVTGTIDFEHMGSFPLKGAVDGQKIAFSIELPEGQGTLQFDGKVDGDKISGATAPHSFKWEASR